MTSVPVIQSADRDGVPAPRFRRPAPPAPARTLQRPGAGPAVRRPRLVHALPGCDGAPLALLVAPAGYGKTTLLREWAERDARPFAWLTLDDRHDDGRRILAAAARAVDAAVGDDAEAPFVLVLDGAHVLRTPGARAGLAAIATDLPLQATLAVASRDELALPVARMRAERRVCELGPRELALTATETAALMRAAGHQLGRAELEQLLQRTEGWPAAVSLAAIALGECGGHGTLARFGGADWLVADYVRDELLAGLPADALDFVTRASVADMLTAPLCDALLRRTGSAAVLEALVRAGALVPVDRTEQRYRHHRLVAETLRAELARREPELEPELHRRACAWHADTGDTDRAIRHALAAGDRHHAAGLVWRQVPLAAAEGRFAMLERWLSHFTAAQLTAEPGLALVAGGCALVRGQGHLVEHWCSVAGASSPPPRLAGTVTAATVAMRAAIAPDGPARMLDDAARASAADVRGGAWQALCCLLEGTAQRLLGAPAEAAPRLAEGARRAAVPAPAVQALCLAGSALLALEEEDWEGAAVQIVRARAQVDRHALGAYPTTALVYAVSALVRAQRGRIEGARADLEAAARLQAALTDFAPCVEAEVSLLLAHAALRLGEPGLARDHVEAAARQLSRTPGVPVLERWLTSARCTLDSLDSVPRAAMTAAELRILRYLPTHLSFREIAERTCVSANTVKSQANAVYRKLAVSSRSEAVEQARARGLLDA